MLDKPTLVSVVKAWGLEPFRREIARLSEFEYVFVLTLARHQHSAKRHVQRVFSSRTASSEQKKKRQHFCESLFVGFRG